MENTNNYYRYIRNEIIELIDTQFSIALDIGCAAGHFGEELKKRYNCEVWGIEPVKEVAELASLKLDKVFNSYFDEKVELGDIKFDIIFFNDVLEHMDNPVQALVKAKKYLAKDGKIIASIPNILHFETITEILKKKDWKYEEAGILDKTHLRFFTRKSIIRMFKSCGLEIESIIGINPSYKTLFRILRKVFPKYLDEMSYIQFAVIAKL